MFCFQLGEGRVEWETPNQVSLTTIKVVRVHFKLTSLSCYYQAWRPPVRSSLSDYLKANWSENSEKKIIPNMEGGCDEQKQQ